MDSCDNIVKPSYFSIDYYEPLKNNFCEKEKGVATKENDKAFVVTIKKEYNLKSFFKFTKIMALYNTLFVVFLLCVPFGVIKTLLIISCVLCAGVSLVLCKDTTIKGFQSVIINNIINIEFCFFYSFVMVFYSNYFILGVCFFSILLFFFHIIWCSRAFIKFLKK